MLSWVRRILLGFLFRFILVEVDASSQVAVRGPTAADGGARLLTIGKEKRPVVTKGTSTLIPAEPFL